MNSVQDLEGATAFHIDYKCKTSQWGIYPPPILVLFVTSQRPKPKLVWKKYQLPLSRALEYGLRCLSESAVKYRTDENSTENMERGICKICHKQKEKPWVLYHEGKYFTFPDYPLFQPHLYISSGNFLVQNMNTKHHLWHRGKQQKLHFLMSNFPWVQRQQVTRGCNYCAMINPLCLHMFSEHSVIVSGEKAQDYLNCHCFPLPSNLWMFFPVVDRLKEAIGPWMNVSTVGCLGWC